MRESAGVPFKSPVGPQLAGVTRTQPAACRRTCKHHGVPPPPPVGSVWYPPLLHSGIPQTSLGRTPTSPLLVLILQQSPFGVRVEWLSVAWCVCVRVFVCVMSLGEPAIELKQPRCVCVCASVEDRFLRILQEASVETSDCLEGALISPNRLKNLSRSQNSVKETFSNVCYSVRCCC